MKTAQSLDGKYLTLTKEGCCPGQCLLGLEDALSKAKIALRPTLRAGNGFGMKAPVSRVTVFTMALGAHPKGGHSSLWPVVGERLNNGISRAAVCTVYEWIEVAPVCWV